MPINFILNDPLASATGASSPKSIKPSSDRPASRSGIAVSGLPAEQNYLPQTVDFIAWQAREAALRAIDAVEAASAPLPGWTGSPDYRLLPLHPVAGQELNAYYDRDSISFFVTRVAGRDVFSGASTDVVAHEAGHAILDAVRPDLWGVNMMEVGAFHEGFGDIVAIVTALSDQGTRVALLQGGLRHSNHVEATAEELSDAIRTVFGATHPASAPRRALNSFKWSFPTSLPANGPPHLLINEEHSLGQLVSGVFYDLVCEIYSSQSRPGQAKLLAASKIALDLTMRAIIAVSVKPRFFEAWGRTMMLVDATAFGGAHSAAIGTAFSNHGFMISTTNFLSPRMRLLSASSRRSRAKTLVTPSTKILLRSALGVGEGEILRQRDIDLGAGPVVEVSATHSVKLTGLSENLAGVESQIQHPALVGEVDQGPALLGAMDPALAYEQEVRAYVATLLTHDAIEFTRSRKSKRSTIGPAVGVVVGSGKTHAVVSRGGTKRLERKAFACGCCRQSG